MRLKGWYTRVAWTWLLAMLLSLAAPAAEAAQSQRSFASPEAAAEELVQRVKANDRPGLLAILGQGAGSWISSGDAVADRDVVARFVAAYEAKHGLVVDNAKAILTIGEDDLPFAFPLIRTGTRWRFDTAAGKEEMLARRIGENELSAINVLQAIIDAQLEYASEDRDGDGMVAYATKFESSPGKQDGLYWPVKPGEQVSPLGSFVAQAASEGYRNSEMEPVPYHGYYYRLLKGQGKHAESGVFDYVVAGRAIGGVAALAYPARYGNSGIMTFIVNQNGKVFQADFGPSTRTRVEQLQRFDPGPKWSPVPTQ